MTLNWLIGVGVTVCVIVMSINMGELLQRDVL